MNEKLKIGVVGLGNVATANYLPYLSKQKDLEIYCCSRSADKAQSCAENFGINACDNMQELAEIGPDTVFILTLENYHFEIACKLLDAGIPRLFIEKPLHARQGQAHVCEQDFFESLELLHKAEKTGADIAMNFNYRFFEQSRRLKKLIADRKLGELRQSAFTVNYACWSHCIDLLLYFCGEIAEVSCISGMRTYHSGDLDATDLTAAFKTANGGTGTILGTAGISFDQPLYHVVLHFENGTVVISDLDTALTFYPKGENFSQVFRLSGNRSRWNQYAVSFQNSIAAYLECLHKNLPPPVSVWDGIRELQFEAALRRSAATGKKVYVSQDFKIA